MLNRFSKRRHKGPPEEAIHIVALWNLMVILIPFLLLSAVFSKTAILNVYLPPPPSAQEHTTALARSHLMVSITREGYIIRQGSKTLASLSKRGADYNYQGLTDLLLKVKAQAPDREDILLLSEPDILYDVIVQTMDAAREGVVETEGKKKTVPLYPNISLGESR